MIEVKNFTKAYSNGKIAVDDISFDVRNGEIFGFLGPNGAGKSTTIKSIVGINSITLQRLIPTAKLLLMIYLLM